jgi:hypothetical protein
MVPLALDHNIQASVNQLSAYGAEPFYTLTPAMACVPCSNFKVTRRPSSP